MIHRMPLGLAWSEAIFATSRDRAAPIEQFKLVASPHGVVQRVRRA